MNKLSVTSYILLYTEETRTDIKFSLELFSGFSLHCYMSWIKKTFFLYWEFATKCCRGTVQLAVIQLCGINDLCMSDFKLSSDCIIHVHHWLSIPENMLKNISDCFFIRGKVSINNWRKPDLICSTVETCMKAQYN